MEDSFNVDKATRTPMKMVAKRLLRKEHATLNEMLPFCRSTEHAIKFRQPFLKELRKKQLQQLEFFFVPCYLYGYGTSAYVHSEKRSYFVAEQYLQGQFTKFNSNNGYFNKEHPASELLQAFSHYTFVKSGGKQLVVDLQGAVDNGWVLLTDPQVLSRAAKSKDRCFGPGDLGFEGMEHFFSTHECGSVCQALNLYNRQKKFQEDMELKHKQCIICLDARRGAKFMPCGHSVACAECALELFKRGDPCPYCRSPIEQYEEGTFEATYVVNKPKKQRQPQPDRPVRLRIPSAPRGTGASSSPPVAASAPADMQSVLLPAAKPKARQQRPALNTRGSR
eukprot:4060874-Amphidinium_carterae.1